MGLEDPTAAGPYTNVTGTPGFLSGSAEMANLVDIADYLVKNGFTDQAAAGVAATIAGESTGNPESVGSGGNGLIGWTPPKGGIITGNANADMATQLPDVLQYADQNGAEALSRGGVSLQTLANMTNVQQAATDWSAFEGPLVKNSDVTNLGPQILTAMGDPSSGSQGGSTTAAPTGFLSDLMSLLGLTNSGDMLERAGLIILGGLLLLIGVWQLTGMNRGKAAAVAGAATGQPEVTEAGIAESGREANRKQHEANLKRTRRSVPADQVDSGEEDEPPF
jgi:hypothetical protein